MKITPARLDGLLLIELAVHRDERGFFTERFHLGDFREAGLLAHFVQDNHSHSAPKVLRGLHYQATPPQGKLVGVVRGRIWDVCVDIRPGSKTYKESFSTELSGKNGTLLWVPPGFAHGFCVLGEEPADVLYKVDAYYNPAGEKGILWNDPDLSIPWPIANPVVSPRDQSLPRFKEYEFSPYQWSSFNP